MPESVALSLLHCRLPEVILTRALLILFVYTADITSTAKIYRK